jgi:DNA-directed RNA polymerase specialized sigma24 family protein
VLYKIPDPHRVLFNLYVVDGYCEADIASSVSVKPEWVSRGIKEAREMVHRELQKKVRLTYASAL